MKPARLPLWYSRVSCAVSLVAVAALLARPLIGSPGIVFYLILTAYLNCLPLAVVSFFLLLKPHTRRTGVINFAVIVLVLYFAVKIFGKSL